MDAKMTNFLHLALAKLLPSLLVAVLTAFITVRLSLKRFRSERWWERKADSYSRIVESIHQMKAWCEDQMESIETGREISEEKEKELRIKFNKASDEIRRAVDIGSFFISSDSEKVLRDLKKELDKAKHEQSFYEYLDYKFASLKGGLAQIQIQAKKDLGV